ncbi:MAG: type II toxin-antitoxin system RelE/ParE family toxin [Candidatus Nealsonbacteria bacterium]|nr:type II toxin-antitoxin system RelE/ParE family toxin [Candidatus Nealsonbacteria bacterium]
MKRVVFHPEAKAELVTAARWYDAQKQGLGRELREEAEAAVSRILAAPEAFGSVRDGERCHQLHRFPYGIVYRVESGRIHIVAVMHLHRDPQYWEDRI